MLFTPSKESDLIRRESKFCRATFFQTLGKKGLFRSAELFLLAVEEPFPSLSGKGDREGDDFGIKAEND